LASAECRIPVPRNSLRKQNSAEKTSEFSRDFDRAFVRYFIFSSSPAQKKALFYVLVLMLSKRSTLDFRVVARKIMLDAKRPPVLL
jgi:hypothetical protein